MESIEAMILSLLPPQLKPARIPMPPVVLPPIILLLLLLLTFLVDYVANMLRNSATGHNEAAERQIMFAHCTNLFGNNGMAMPHDLTSESCFQPGFTNFTVLPSKHIKQHHRIELGSSLQFVNEWLFALVRCVPVHAVATLLQYLLGVGLFPIVPNESEAFTDYRTKVR